MPLHRVNCQLLSPERRERGNLFQNSLSKELEFGLKKKSFSFFFWWGVMHVRLQLAFIAGSVYLSGIK